MHWSRELKAASRGLRTAMRVASAMLTPPAAVSPLAAVGGLIEIPAFGANPGGLSMLAYVPAGLPVNAPLVVVLHGCGQEAAAFAADAGWMALADRVGLALVLPEQSEGNNRQRCFNWFRPVHVTRGRGEAASIREMVGEATRRFRSDPGAVFVVGLSAGGAMAAALLAAYPDVFAAGASVAGLPVGAASGAASALARMAQAGPDGRSAEAWAGQVRRAAPAGYTGPWPRLSIWHGARDTVVDPANAGLLAQQWCALHGLDAAPSATSHDLAACHTVWGGRRPPAVELWTLPQLGHAYPVMPGGSPTTERIAQFLGLPD